MDSRQSTPDVLGSIMSGTTKQETKEKMFLPVKEKVTFNLPLALLEQLEVVWMNMRKVSSKKISKTLIVETALQQAFSDLEDHQEKSSFYARLIKKK